MNNNLINKIYAKIVVFFAILGMFALNQSQTKYIYDICIMKIEFERADIESNF